MEPTPLGDIKVIDVDTHVVEPYDLWTSRVSTKRWGDLVPHVVYDKDAKGDVWVSGDAILGTATAAAAAGWSEPPPSRAPTLADVDDRVWRSSGRLELMDEYGIHAQILYPNVALFGTGGFASLDDASLGCCLAEAYNDFQTEFASIAPDRLIPVASIPFWDLDAGIRELERCKEMGHRGFIFTQAPEFFGQPTLSDPHWDRLWAAAQEMQMPVNFHIASGDIGRDRQRSGTRSLHASCGEAANFVVGPLSFFVGNTKTIATLIAGGICHRFPDLNFVSVESGVGWIPFVLDGLEWMWDGCEVAKEHPEFDLRPTEYFQRQIYGCFWFEHGPTLERAIEALGADSILYETDFPHAVSMVPGPASPAALSAKDFINERLGGLGQDTLRKVLHDNAARVYHLDG